MTVPYTPTQLKDDILQDPGGLGTAAMVSAAEGGSDTYSRDADIAAAFNAASASFAVRQPFVARAAIKIVLLARGKLGGLLAATSPYAKMAQVLFGDPDFAVVNLDDQTAWQPLTAALVSETSNNVSGNAGVAQADVDALQALGDSRPVSFAQQRYGVSVVVTQADVSLALRGVK
jgi:hypothetical protein